METGALPFVILRHTFEDEPERNHYDMLLETEPGDDPEERSLTAFRIEQIPDETGSFAGERLPMHRRHYLTYEGPVSGGRGHVERVRSGEARVEDNFASIQVFAKFDGGGAYRISGIAVDASSWGFLVLPEV